MLAKSLIALLSSISNRRLGNIGKVMFVMPFMNLFCARFNVWRLVVYCTAETMVSALSSSSSVVNTGISWNASASMLRTVELLMTNVCNKDKPVNVPAVIMASGLLLIDKYTRFVNPVLCMTGKRLLSK